MVSAALIDPVVNLPLPCPGAISGQTADDVVALDMADEEYVAGQAKVNLEIFAGACWDDVHVVRGCDSGELAPIDGIEI